MTPDRPTFKRCTLTTADGKTIALTGITSIVYDDGPPPAIAGNRILRLLILKAIYAFDGWPYGDFTSATFADAVRERFDLKHPPDGRWCHRVLSGLLYIKPLGIGGSYWRYTAGRPAEPPHPQGPAQDFGPAPRPRTG